jgi:hypothetical protein
MYANVLFGGAVLLDPAGKYCDTLGKVSGKYRRKGFISAPLGISDAAFDLLCE